MVTIKDAALGEYSIEETNQGYSVKGEDDKKRIKANSMEDALKWIANQLVLDSATTYTLSGYAQKRKEVYEKIVKAQDVQQDVEDVPFVTIED
jgi:predicted nucleic acid-binding protein